MINSNVMEAKRVGLFATDVGGKGLDDDLLGWWKTKGNLQICRSCN